MRLIIGLSLLAAVAFVNCHPTLDILNEGVNLEAVDVNAGVNSNVSADSELIRKARSFGGGRRFCCGGGGGGYGRQNYGRGGGGGFGGSFSSARASASSSSGSFGFGK